MRLFVGAFFSCMLLLLCAPGADFGVLGWIAWVPFVYTLREKELNLRETAVVFFVFGFFVSLAVLFWVRHVAYLGLFLLSFYFAMHFVLSGVVTIYLYRKTNVPFSLIFAVVFTLSEYLRGVLFTGFPWFLMGWSQYDFPSMIQFAKIGGVYGVSFIVLLVNGFLCDFVCGLMKKIKNKYVFLVLAVCVVLINFIYGSYEIKEYDKKTDLGEFKVFAVQGNVYPSLFWNPAYSYNKFDKYKRMTLDLFNSDVDMIIWPEGAVDGELRYHEANFEFIRNTAVNFNRPFFLQSNDLLYKGGKSLYYNSVFLFSAEGSLVDNYYKNHLVPFGEYTPLRKYISFLSKFVPIPENFTPGNEIKLLDFPMGDKAIKAAPLICFEDIFPSHVGKFMRLGADVMVNVTNDGWFKKSFAPFQHMALASFRAVENSRPLIRVANTGISCSIDGVGRLASVLADGEGKSLCRDAAGVLKVRVKDDKQISFYTANGDVFIFSVMLIFFIFVILALKNKKVSEV